MLPYQIKKILEEDRNAVNDRDNLRGSPAIKLAAQWLGSGVGNLSSDKQTSYLDMS